MNRCLWIAALTIGAARIAPSLLAADRKPLISTHDLRRSRVSGSTSASGPWRRFGLRGNFPERLILPGISS